MTANEVELKSLKESLQDTQPVGAIISCCRTLDQVIVNIISYQWTIVLFMSVRLACMEKISFLLVESISKCTAVSICILLQFHGPVPWKLVTFNPSLRQIICKVFSLKKSLTLRCSFDNRTILLTISWNTCIMNRKVVVKIFNFPNFAVFARPSRKVVNFVTFVVFARSSRKIINFANFAVFARAIAKNCSFYKFRSRVQFWT